MCIISFNPHHSPGGSPIFFRWKTEAKPQLHSKLSMRIYSLLSLNTLLFLSFLMLALPPHSTLSFSATAASLSLFPWGSWPWALCWGCRVQTMLISRHRHGCPFTPVPFSSLATKQLPVLQTSFCTLLLCSITLAICWPPGLGHFLPRLNLCLEHPSCLLPSQMTRSLRLRVAFSGYPCLTPPVPWQGHFFCSCASPHLFPLYSYCLFACLPLLTLIDS